MTPRVRLGNGRFTRLEPYQEAADPDTAADCVREAIELYTESPLLKLLLLSTVTCYCWRGYVLLRTSSCTTGDHVVADMQCCRGQQALLRDR